MPRFTIGSLATGVLLSLGIIWVLQTIHANVSIGHAIDSGRMAPPGGPQPLAVDPTVGTVALGMEKANDYALEDSFHSDGGLDAATW